MLLDIINHFDKIANLVTFVLSIYLPIALDKRRRFEQAISSAIRDLDAGISYTLSISQGVENKKIEYVSHPIPSQLFSDDTINLFIEMEQTETAKFLMMPFHIAYMINDIHKHAGVLACENETSADTFDLVKNYIRNSKKDIRTAISKTCIKSKIWGTIF